MNNLSLSKYLTAVLRFIGIRPNPIGVSIHKTLGKKLK